MKKKILSLALAVALAAIAIVGGTLAYFTDTDAQTNTFTYGNVKIDLFEDFNSEKLNIVPAVFVPANGGNLTNLYGTMINKIEKEVYVENEGSEEAYVRVHIAVPKIASVINDSETEGMDASAIVNGKRDILNLSRDEYSTVNGKWNWGTDATQTYNNRTPNTYEVTIREIPYTVYVVTYETKLAAKDGDFIDATCDAINGVYMHPAVTNEMIAALDQKYADEEGSPIWARIYVVAEAAQADGFNISVDDEGNKTEIENAETDGTAAFKALNTAFGDTTVAGEAGGQLTAEDFLAAPEGDEFKEWKALNGTN